MSVARSHKSCILYLLTKFAQHSGAQTHVPSSGLTVGVFAHLSNLRSRLLLGAPMSEDDLVQRFTEAFDHGIWNDNESVSGPGSTLRYTSDLRATLPGLIRALGCKSMLDAPCGDFNWMKEVDLSGIDYMGVDIVPALIANHRAKYQQHRFAVQDITKDAFPKVDFVLCRDVLFHLSNSSIV